MKKKFIIFSLFLVLVLLLSLTSFKFLSIMNLGKLKGDITLGSNEAMFDIGDTVNIKIKKLAGATGYVTYYTENTTVKTFTKSNSLAITPKEANIISVSNSPMPIYAWYSNGTIYWYSEASKVYLNPDSSTLFSDFSSVKTINFNGVDTSKVEDMGGMFSRCSSITTLDLSGFNTSNVTNMRYMFSECNSLTSLNLSSFNTSNVTNMQRMFHNCKSLTSLDLNSFNTSKVTDMSNMFSSTLTVPMALKEIKGLNKFNTSKTTTMEFMFFGCTSLTTLDLSSFDTSNVTTMRYMFSGLVNVGTPMSLTQIKGTENLNASKVEDMSYMFYLNKKLKSLDLSNFNPKNSTNMHSMFSGCEGLTSINLRNFDTSKVTNMGDMFRDCKSIASLNLSSFNTSKVTNMSQMFLSCNNLQTIYVSEKFVTPSDIILNNIKLVGGNGTICYPGENTYARIDKAGSPGCFTGPTGKVQIDSPGSTVATSELKIYGWALGTVFNQAIYVYMDGTKIGEATRYNRSDDSSIYSLGSSEKVGEKLDNPQPGYQLSYDASKLKTGSHTVKVIIYDKDNKKTIAQASKTFTYSEKTIISIDTPAANGTVTNANTAIMGWVMSTVKNKKVNVYVDSTGFLDVTRINRDDDNAIYELASKQGAGDKARNPQPGYTVKNFLDGLSNLTAGTHTITVKVVKTSTNEVIATKSQKFTISSSVLNTSYKITYNYNNGTSPKTETKSYKYYDAESTFGTVPTMTRTGYNLLGWSTDKNATKATYSKTYKITRSFIKANAGKTLYAVWDPYKVSVYYNAGGGKIVKTDINFTLDNNTVYKDGVKYAQTVAYDKTLNPANYDNVTYLNIEKTGYTAKSGAEWINKTNSKTYNQNTTYKSTDFCDSSKSNCSVTLTVNWVKNSVDISKLKVKNNTYIIQKKNDTKKTITDLIGTTGVKITSDNVEISENTKLKTGSILIVNGKSYKIVIIGDTNKDSNVNLQDVSQIYSYIKNKTSSSLDDVQQVAADSNEDNSVTIQDVSKLYTEYKRGIQ